MSFSLPIVPNSLARFIEKWASKRLPEPDTHATIVRQRLYILPTRQGMIFFLILFLIFLGAVNYENSLSFMLTFFIMSICIIGMIHTHQNINHLRISTSNPKAVFSGQTALFPIKIQSKSNHAHYNITLQVESGSAVTAHIHNNSNEAFIELPMKTQARGYLPLEKIKVSTEFPFGLFHAWSWINLKTNCLVYPKPDESFTNKKYASFSKGHKRATNLPGYDDFSNIRKYQPGDAINHLAWKSIAKTKELQTKQFHAEAGKEIIFDWDLLPKTIDTETKLSILCHLIIDAELHGLNYGLKIPDFFSKPQHGTHHRHACLKALALFGKNKTA